MVEVLVKVGEMLLEVLLVLISCNLLLSDCLLLLKCVVQPMLYGFKVAFHYGLHVMLNGGKSML